MSPRLVDQSVSITRIALAARCGASKIAKECAASRGRVNKGKQGKYDACEA